MEPAQAIQPFIRLVAVAITFPLRKKIVGPDGCAALSPIPAPSAKKAAGNQDSSTNLASTGNETGRGEIKKKRVSG